MRIIGYWRLVARRAWQEAWKLVTDHSLRTLARDAAFFCVAASLFWWFYDDLVKIGLTSPDNLKDTIVWIGVVCLVIAIIFSALFVLEALAIVPFKLWWEENKARTAAEQSAHDAIKQMKLMEEEVLELVAEGKDYKERVRKLKANKRMKEIDQHNQSLRQLEAQEESNCGHVIRSLRRAEYLIRNPQSDLNPKTHFQTSKDAWFGCMVKFEELYKNALNEDLNLCNNDEHTRFTHIPAVDEPENLPDEMQADYRRLAAIKHDFERIKRDMDDRLKSEKARCEAILCEC